MLLYGINVGAAFDRCLLGAPNLPWTDGRALHPSRPSAATGSTYASELNAEQLRVVFHPGGPMLALAGAGRQDPYSVYRASRLVEDGVRRPRPAAGPSPTRRRARCSTASSGSPRAAGAG